MVRHGPEILCEGSPPIVLDIVFVHGLRGDAIDTWSKGTVCWPRDLLKEEIPNVRVITWGYDSTIANLKTFSSQNSIFGHSENLLLDLARQRRRTERALFDPGQKPIIFVGHSLGGLVIKEALIRSAEYLNAHQDDYLGAIYKDTKGVIFMGTPHRGSDKFSLGDVVAKAANVAWRQPNQALLNTLAQDSDVLEHQNKSFDTKSSSMTLVCLYEEIPTAIGMVSFIWT